MGMGETEQDRLSDEELGQLLTDALMALRCSGNMVPAEVARVRAEVGRDVEEAIRRRNEVSPPHSERAVRLHVGPLDKPEK